MNRLTSEEALEALDVMDVAVIIADVINGGSWVTWVNPAFTRVFGYPLEEMIDGGFERVIGPNTDTEDIQRAYRQVLAGSRGTTTNLGYCADGTAIWSSFTMSPVTVQGRVVRWVGVQHDVSEYIHRSEQDRRSYEIERRARIGLSVVGAASEIMADVDTPYPLRAVAEMLQGRFVPWAGFFTVEDGMLRPVERIEPEAERRPSRRLRVPPGDARPGGRDPVLRVLESSEPVRARVPLDGDHPPGSAAAALVALVRPYRAAFPNLGDEVLVVPVVGRRRTLCVLAVLPRATDVEEAQGAEETATIVELAARRIGLAMENAQLYAHEHRVAETLQRAMLPEQAHIADLDVWTYYAPNVEHAQVGGDWYDVLHVSDTSVGVVIGDVAGHDIEAAAAMGQLRSVVRSYACELVDPGTVLRHVDRLVLGMRIPRYASLVYAALTPDGEGWDVAYCRAGHLPPLLVRGGAVVRLDSAGGMLVGVGEPARATAHARATPGDVLVFFTDGLVERRDRTLRDGVRALIEVCARLRATDAAGVGEELLSRFADAAEDDVAVVVVRVPERDDERQGAGGAGPRRRRWILPGEPQSIGRARHAVLTTCAAWGIEDNAAAELVVSELAANAVMHGWGRVNLRLEDTGDGLRIEVADSNPAPPMALQGYQDRVGGFGLHIIDRLADWGWRRSGEGKVVWAKITTTRDALGRRRN